ncbi:penicillin-binding protein activator [Marinobacter sp. ELB17]|uniref:penicillin-binding protein activator n=1 Tax=Marinobacter sp. ELB17 TaxID=270374 RepID=UPI001D0D6EE5|nr:penicillin-binding protein activator [Marinobacter sp. ELB17]
MTLTSCELMPELLNFAGFSSKLNHPEHAEPAMTNKRLAHPAIAGLLVAILLTAGCAGVDLQSQVVNTPAQALELASQERNQDTAQRYLLRIASRFQQQGDHQGARKLLQSGQLAQPLPELASQKRLLAMNGAVTLKDQTWAQQITANLSINSFMEVTPELLNRAGSLQAQTLALAGNPLEAAKTLIALAQADSSANAQPLHDRIWQLLKTVSDTQLSSADTREIGYETQGWLELATQVRSPGTGFDEQGRVIRRWQSNWPGHPAAQLLPSELQLIAGLAASRPEQIVLALPLNGPLTTAGKAIRDGFLAAYFSDTSVDREATRIRVVDSKQKPFGELYQELAKQPVDLLVGPLDKGALAELGKLPSLPLQTLALNYLPPGVSAPAGLYQFGLSAEDEARQIADRLGAEGLKRILVIIPSGEWGNRVEAALIEQMAKHGGRVIGIQRFLRKDNLRAVTADLLGINTSRDRAIDVERTIGLNIEFEARRRQDAQAIVMVAEPDTARQLNPLFAFYFAGDLPVYAPSIVYAGTPAPGRDRDLNGVIFTDIPWVLDEKNPLRDEAGSQLPGATRGQLGRLFAMGADAWHLSKRLPLLRQVPEATIDGQTGVLAMTPSGSIRRYQRWARFSSGNVELLPAIAASLPKAETNANQPQAKPAITGGAL